MAADNRQDPTFEESLDRLQEIVARLEKGEAPLEEGLTLFEEGVELTRRCHTMLERAEQKVSRLVRNDDDEPSLELFPRDEE